MHGSGGDAAWAAASDRQELVIRDSFGVVFILYGYRQIGLGVMAGVAVWNLVLCGFLFGYSESWAEEHEAAVRWSDSKILRFEGKLQLGREGASALAGHRKDLVARDRQRCDVHAEAGSVWQSDLVGRGDPGGSPSKKRMQLTGGRGLK